MHCAPPLKLIRYRSETEYLPSPNGVNLRPRTGFRDPIQDRINLYQGSVDARRSTISDAACWVS